MFNIINNKKQVASIIIQWIKTNKSMLWDDVYLYSGYERDNNYFGSEEAERKQMSTEKKQFSSKSQGL